ncbi:MAG: cysteine-rich CWC family protein [Burkholderiaceae bacterium]
MRRGRQRTPCPCTTLTLSPTLLAQLRQRYQGCLCLGCLAELTRPPRRRPARRHEPAVTVLARRGPCPLAEPATPRSSRQPQWPICRQARVGQGAGHACRPCPHPATAAPSTRPDLLASLTCWRRACGRCWRW